MANVPDFKSIKEGLDYWTKELESTVAKYDDDYQCMCHSAVATLNALQRGMDTDKVEITIGRLSGPCTDRDIVAEFRRSDIEAIKDVLRSVNSCTHNKERWYLRVDDDNTVVPVDGKEPIKR